MKKINSGNKTRSYKPIKLHETLTKINNRITNKIGKSEYVIHSNWQKIVGSFFANHSEPDSITENYYNINTNDDNFKEKILVVNVSPGASVEFQHFADKIVEKINSHFGYKAISRLKIKQKYISKTKIYDSNSASNQKKVINNDKKNDINITTKKINDKELKKALSNLGISIVRNEKE